MVICLFRNSLHSIEEQHVVVGGISLDRLENTHGEWGVLDFVCDNLKAQFSPFFRRLLPYRRQYSSLFSSSRALLPVHSSISLTAARISFTVSGARKSVSTDTGFSILLSLIENFQLFLARAYMLYIHQYAGITSLLPLCALSVTMEKGSGMFSSAG